MPKRFAHDATKNSNQLKGKKMNRVSKIKTRHLARWITGIGTAAFLALGAVPAQADHAVLSVTSGAEGCYDLLAGQTIDAGDVCFEVIEDNKTLAVTYTTDGDWELTEAHLWVGEDQDGYPMSKKGNPKIGNFPHNSGNITGTVTHSFYVPLGSVQWFFDMDDLDAHCDEARTVYAMAHAAVQLVDGSGTVLQTETGWSDGEGAVEKGSWATRTAITLSVTCDGPPPPPPTLGQETALMLGNIELNDETDAVCLQADGSDAFGASRWGWQEGPLSAGSYVRDIWAAAGQNDLSKGTLVGYVDIVVSSGNVTVTPELFEGFEAEETHIYIGTEPVCSGAFGNAWNDDASTNIDTSGGVYVGVHFSVKAECGINPDSPDNFCE